MDAPRGTVVERLAGAPISWGVCEVPGWGVMLPRERVLSEMRGLGLQASELGALGYLGSEPEEIRDLLASFSLSAVGGFVPLVLHEPAARKDMVLDAERAARLIAGAGGSYFVTAVVADAGWSAPFDLDGPGWDELASGLATVERICADHGLAQVLHPHLGTLVERGEHIAEVLERSDVSWCLDTGHLAIGGVDPPTFAAEHADRVGLVHLKDVDLSLAPGVAAHELTLLEATKAGLFRALGRGDVDVAAVVTALEARGYSGWYVLEQDTTIAEVDAGSVDPAADVRTSIDYLRHVPIDEVARR
ncbi:MAG TPA: sugar phosphate isomerase/epimerase [Acidimicrobiales bacterium]|nr:sugar phosphate isomerase/epimerase [Acidimicrobiales bacterium]